MLALVERKLLLCMADDSVVGVVAAWIDGKVKQGQAMVVVLYVLHDASQACTQHLV